jgi:hypothetical protein
LPRVQSSVRWLLVFTAVIALVIVGVSLLCPARRHVAHSAIELRFRVVDAADRRRIGRARILVDNIHLAQELGEASEVETAADGRASITHRFLALVERRGVVTSGHVSFQGPWIQVSAEGYETLGLPLSDIVGPRRRLFFFTTPPESVIKLRRGRIEGIDLADLAGDYSYGTGYINHRLGLTRAGRYHYRYGTHTGFDAESEGRYAVADGVIRLIPERSSSPDTLEPTWRTLVPIRWGDRLYLIPERHRVAFCSDVNRGIEPGYLRRGKLDFMEANRHLPAGVMPELPAAWRSYLLAKPVAGTITEVLPDSSALVDRGERDGIKAGMILMSEERQGSYNLPARVMVLNVEADRCLVKLSEPEFLDGISDRPMRIHDALAAGGKIRSTIGKRDPDRPMVQR